MQRVATALGVLSLLLGVPACDFREPFVHVDMPPTGPTFNEVMYFSVGWASIPAADLSAIGQAEGELGELSTDGTVYAVEGIDPANLIAIAIDPERWNERVANARAENADYHPPSPAPTHELLTPSGDPEELPAVVCGYFDPRSEATPLVCQKPVSVVVGGQTYVILNKDPSGKVPIGSFVSFSSGVEPVGPLEDVDPRLYFGLDVDTTAYAVTGIDPADLIVVALGSGADLSYVAFLREGVAEVPTALCDNVEPDRAEIVGCAPMSDGPLASGRPE